MTGLRRSCRRRARSRGDAIGRGLGSRRARSLARTERDVRPPTVLAAVRVPTMPDPPDTVAPPMRCATGRAAVGCSWPLGALPLRGHDVADRTRRLAVRQGAGRVESIRQIPRAAAGGGDGGADGMAHCADVVRGRGVGVGYRQQTVAEAELSPSPERCSSVGRSSSASFSSSSTVRRVIRAAADLCMAWICTPGSSSASICWACRP